MPKTPGSFTPIKQPRKRGDRTGIKNKKTVQWEVFSKHMMEGGLVKFQECLDKLNPKDYVNAMTNLMEFFKPRLQRTEVVDESRKAYLRIDIPVTAEAAAIFGISPLQKQEPLLPLNQPTNGSPSNSILQVPNQPEETTDPFIEDRDRGAPSPDVSGDNQG